MAFVSSQKSRLLLGDFSLSAFLRNTDAQSANLLLESSVLTSTAKEFICGGEDESTFAGDGLLDIASTADLQFDQLNDLKSATAAEPISYGPNGLALGAELWMVGAWERSFKVNSTRTSTVDFGLEAVCDGPVDFGLSLHDLAAVTADESGSALNGGAASTNGGVAHLHVTAFSGFSGADIIVEDSANGSTGWATIGTFTTVAGLTQQRLAITGTIRQYTRYTADVTGTGSITFAVGIARR